jgi:hypothetical protein
MLHKFKLGQTVTFLPSVNGVDRNAKFEIVRVMPSERGMNQYRLKALLDGHERVALENELS